MDEHLTDERLRQLRNDTARLRELLAYESAEPPSHVTEEELFGWVDGTLDDAAREQVRAHLDECAICSGEVADLLPLRARPRQRSTWIWAAAAAAVLALALLLVLRPHRAPTQPPVARAPRPVTPPQQENKPSQPYANAEWNALVAQALASGRLPHRADIAWLRRGPEILRGDGEEGAETFRPSGAVIEPDRPELSWPPVAGARYAVSIYRGDVLVARSETLTRERWTPPRSLDRGSVYLWQVEATSASGSQILPAPPTPPARFFVLDRRDHDDLVIARREHPDDHLLLAALYARAGMEAEAQEQLRALGNLSDPRVQRIQAHELGRSSYHPAPITTNGAQ